MGNITSVFLIILALSIGSFLVLGADSSNVLIKFVMDPSGSITWLMVLESFKWASATALITTAAALFFFKNETILWAGVFGALAAMAFDPMKDLYLLISPYSTVIAALVVAPIYLYIIFTMVNWLRAPR